MGHLWILRGGGWVKTCLGWGSFPSTRYSVLAREVGGNKLWFKPCGNTTGSMGNITKYGVPYWVCMLAPFVHGKVPIVVLPPILVGDNE